MEVINPKDYEIGFTDQFFFDTNVWLLIYADIASFESKNQQLYSDFLQSTIQKDKPIFITSMVLSEFANVILRKDFNQWKEKNGFDKKYKEHYVGTIDYRNTVELVSNFIRKILSLPNVTKVSDNFNGVDIDNILKNFRVIDFNDAYFIELCLRNNYKIVTNDGDFQKIEKTPITIISSKV